MTANSSFDIVAAMGIKAQNNNNQEHKIPKYKRDIYNCSLSTSKSEYNAAVDCDVYISGSAMHFQTSKKHGEYNQGYATLQEAYTVIQAMAKLRVPGIWDIAQNIETGKYEIIPAPRYNKK